MKRDMAESMLTTSSFQLKRRTGWKMMGTVLAAVSLVACGGSGGDDDGTVSPPGSQPLSVGAASLAGDWLSRICTPAGANRSLKLRLRVVQAGDNAVAYSQTFVRYPSSDCSGTGTADSRSTSLGTVTFSRSDANTRAAANWGLWVLPNGVQSGTIWGKKGRDSTLCIGATDRDFSSLNTLPAVSAWMDVSDTSCHDLV
ncbi:MAG: hypothetical protein C0453_05140 [Comamonadaceae bacterium]|nr:hypothetical protein [Comamonadaceae bacterium]